MSRVFPRRIDLINVQIIKPTNATVTDDGKHPFLYSLFTLTIIG